MKQPLCLISDGDGANRTWMCDVIRRLGAEPREAWSGAEVVRLLGEEPFDLVVADADMTPPSGLDALAHARRMRLRTPFVVTSTGGEEVSRRTRELGGALILPKPIRGEDLRTLVTKILLRSQLQSASPRLAGDDARSSPRTP